MSDDDVVASDPAALGPVGEPAPLDHAVGSSPFAGFRNHAADDAESDAAQPSPAAVDAAEPDAAEPDAAEPAAPHPTPVPPSPEDRRVQQTLIAGLLIVAALTALVGWLSLRTAQSDRADLRRAAFVAAAGRFAVDLTTVDYQNPQADVQRVLDAATGQFYQRFADRAPLLIETVTREHAQAVSSVSAIGVQSQSRTGDRAKVLVALSVASVHLGGLEERPHEMRMQLTMNWVGDRAKVSNVEYVR